MRRRREGDGELDRRGAGSRTGATVVVGERERRKERKEVERGRERRGCEPGRRGETEATTAVGVGHGEAAR